MGKNNVFIYPRKRPRYVQLARSADDTFCVAFAVIPQSPVLYITLLSDLCFIENILCNILTRSPQLTFKGKSKQLGVTGRIVPLQGSPLLSRSPVFFWRLVIMLSESICLLNPDPCYAFIPAWTRWSIPRKHSKTRASHCNVLVKWNSLVARGCFVNILWSVLFKSLELLRKCVPWAVAGLL